MRRFLSPLPSLLILLATVTACSEQTPTDMLTPPDLSDAVIENTRAPFEAFIDGCLDDAEDLEGTGTFRRVVRVTESSSDRISVGIHVNAKGRFVGLTSGAIYEWTDAFNHSVTFNPSIAPAEQTITQTTRLTSHGPAPDRVIKVRIHMTFNANGEITSSHADFEDVCR